MVAAQPCPPRRARQRLNGRATGKRGLPCGRSPVMKIMKRNQAPICGALPRRSLRMATTPPALRVNPEIKSDRRPLQTISGDSRTVTIASTKLMKITGEPKTESGNSLKIRLFQILQDLVEKTVNFGRRHHKAYITISSWRRACQAARGKHLLRCPKDEQEYAASNAINTNARTKIYFL